MAAQQTNAQGVTYTNYQRDTPEANKQEKRALLAMMAEKGTEGAAEYERNKQLTKQTRASSVEMAAARGLQAHAPSALQAEVEQDYDQQMAGILANTDAGMLSHAREMDRISAANSSYIDAASAASKLQADLLDKGMLAGGGGGGGRGGGGGGGGSRGPTFGSDPDVLLGDAPVTLMDMYQGAELRGEPVTRDNMLNEVQRLRNNGLITPEQATRWSTSIRNEYNPTVASGSPTNAQNPAYMSTAPTTRADRREQAARERLRMVLGFIDRQNAGTRTPAPRVDPANNNGIARWASGRGRARSSGSGGGSSSTRS